MIHHTLAKFTASFIISLMNEVKCESDDEINDLVSCILSKRFTLEFINEVIEEIKTEKGEK